MKKLWAQGPSLIREIQEAFPDKERPSHTTIQMTIYRMEVEKIVRRTQKVGNFHIFEALVSREAAQQRLEVSRSSAPPLNRPVYSSRRQHAEQ